jgi:hypothetical protein
LLFPCFSQQVASEGQEESSTTVAVVSTVTTISSPTSTSSSTNNTAGGGLDIPSPPGRMPAPTAAMPLVYPNLNSPTAPSAPPTSHSAPRPNAFPTHNFQPPRGLPINNNDPRVKDCAELCNFALTALKVCDILRV